MAQRGSPSTPGAFAVGVTTADGRSMELDLVLEPVLPE